MNTPVIITTSKHLGRETFLTPITFQEDGWFVAGNQGITEKIVETDKIAEGIQQKRKKLETFETTDWKKDWNFLRTPEFDNYKFCSDKLIVKGSNISIDETDSPTFLGLRQKEFKGMISCQVTINHGQAGIIIYMDEEHHYDLLVGKEDEQYYVSQKINIDRKSVV